MERYNSCTDSQKEILNKLYWYLGFNEATTFDVYIQFIFKNVKQNTSFEHLINHVLAHIVTNFWHVYPQYRHGYIKYNWINENDFIKYTTPGKGDYDPKGLLRLYVKNNFKYLLETKR